MLRVHRVDAEKEMRRGQARRRSDFVREADLSRVLGGFDN
jgi:hypothetical protein